MGPAGMAMASRKIKKYGWRPDTPDHRDLMYSGPEHLVAKSPPKVDLRPQCTPVYDQGQLGSCTGNAIGAAYAFVVMLVLKVVFMPSRLFIYYNERVMEGTVSQDAGAEIRDGIKAIAALGVCPEKTWPYVVSKFARKPTKAAFASGLKHQALKYMRVSQTLAQMKACLAEGFPIVLGFSVYESFESDEVARTGVVPMPSKAERMLGGHAVLVVGYDDATGTFLVRNSWGDKWGQAGYFTVPYAYFTNPGLCDDLWTIRMVEG